MLTDDRTSAAVRLSCGMPSHLRTCQAVWQGFIYLPILLATGTRWVLSGGHVSLEHWDFDGNDSVFQRGHRRDLSLSLVMQSEKAK